MGGINTNNTRVTEIAKLIIMEVDKTTNDYDALEVVEELLIRELASDIPLNQIPFGESFEELKNAWVTYRNKYSHLWENEEDMFDSAFDLAYSHNQDWGVGEDDIVEVSREDACKLLELLESTRIWESV